MQCPYCQKELPPMGKEEALQILEELKKVPGFMKTLGEEAAKAYFNVEPVKPNIMYMSQEVKDQYGDLID